jgi:integrase/recombinase XerC
MNYDVAFIQYLEVEKRFSQHTVKAYQLDLTEFKAFAEVSIDSEWLEVDHQLIRAWMVELLEKKLTNKTVNRKISTLRSFFKWLKNVGLSEVNPVLKVKPPKIEKRLPQFVKSGELEDQRISPVFNSDFDGQRDRLMLELFYQTGIRLSELIELKEINVDSQQIKVLGKRNKERIVPISNELFILIQKYRLIKPKGQNSLDFFFCQKNGKKINPMFVYRKINNYLGTVSNVQKKSPHVLRHTFATHMLNNGAGLETLKELLGHASLAATQVYTHNSFAQISSIYSSAHPRGQKK